MEPFSIVALILAAVSIVVSFILLSSMEALKRRESEEDEKTARHNEELEHLDAKIDDAFQDLGILEKATKGEQAKVVKSVASLGKNVEDKFNAFNMDLRKISENIRRAETFSDELAALQGNIDALGQTIARLQEASEGRATGVEERLTKVDNTLELLTDDSESSLSKVEKLASGVRNTLELLTDDSESRLSKVEKKLATDLEEVKKAIKSLTDKLDHELRDAKDSLGKKITELTAQVAVQRDVVKKLQDTPDLSDVEGSVGDLRRALDGLTDRVRGLEAGRRRALAGQRANITAELDDLGDEEPQGEAE
ncbi:MAG: hypothetical protein F4071_00300 [Acidimicrobiaceae bacterium]|nr:hypothetical protein [Acidimicrobiaceae bacterium]